MSGVHRRALLAFAAIAASVTLSAHATTMVAPPQGLDGVWEGTLTTATGPGIAVPPDNGYPSIRIAIDQRNARVYLGGEEVKAGTFTIEREATNAVITSIQADPGSPVGAGWVETWTFVVTLAGPDTLAVTFVRVVNNNHLRPDQDQAHFTQVHTGQFRRVSDVR